jgi:hypothetical protein
MEEQSWICSPDCEIPWFTSPKPLSAIDPPSCRLVFINGITTGDPTAQIIRQWRGVTLFGGACTTPSDVVIFIYD